MDDGRQLPTTVRRELVWSDRRDSDLSTASQEHRRTNNVNTSSIAGRVTVQSMAAYCVSKFGVESFSDVLRYV